MTVSPVARPARRGPPLKKGERPSPNIGIFHSDSVLSFRCCDLRRIYTTGACTAPLLEVVVAKRWAQGGVGGATLGTGAAAGVAGVARGASENAVCDGAGQLSEIP